MHAAIFATSPERLFRDGTARWNQDYQVNLCHRLEYMWSPECNNLNVHVRFDIWSSQAISFWWGAVSCIMTSWNDTRKAGKADRRESKLRYVSSWNFVDRFNFSGDIQESSEALVRQESFEEAFMCLLVPSFAKRTTNIKHGPNTTCAPKAPSLSRKDSSRLTLWIS